MCSKQSSIPDFDSVFPHPDPNIDQVRLSFYTVNILELKGRAISVPDLKFETLMNKCQDDFEMETGRSSFKKLFIK